MGETMRDFNFFEPYLNPNDKKSSLNYLWGVLIVICLVAIIIFHMTLLKKHKTLQSDLEIIERYNTDVTVVKKLNDITIKKEEAFATENALNQIMSRIGVLDSRANFDDVFLQQLNATVPEFVFISSVQFATDRYYLSGYANAYQNVSQFVFNLKEVDNFKHANLLGVKDELGQFQFEIEIPIPILSGRIQ